MPFSCILRVDGKAINLRIRIPTFNVLNNGRNNGFISEVFIAHMTKYTDFSDPSGILHFIGYRLAIGDMDSFATKLVAPTR